MVTSKHICSGWEAEELRVTGYYRAVERDFNTVGTNKPNPAGKKDRYIPESKEILQEGTVIGTEIGKSQKE